MNLLIEADIVAVVANGIVVHAKLPREIMFDASLEHGLCELGLGAKRTAHAVARDDGVIVSKDGSELGGGPLNVTSPWGDAQ